VTIASALSLDRRPTRIETEGTRTAPTRPGTVVSRAEESPVREGKECSVVPREESPEEERFGVDPPCAHTVPDRQSETAIARRREFREIIGRLRILRLVFDGAVEMPSFVIGKYQSISQVMFHRLHCWLPL